MTQDGRVVAAQVFTSARAAVDQGEATLAESCAVTVRRAFRGTLDQVAQVREFVRLAAGPVPLLDEVVLLASELSTNAVVHTASGYRGTFDVAVRRYPSSVRVEISDSGSPGAPAARLPDDLAEEGRGLGLVALVADEWRHSGDQDGRSVFFELRW